MKKTLIALAVAASAAVSGSAMAWTQGGIGSDFEMGGTLTPDASGNPWAVKVGNALQGLDTKVATGTKNVVFNLKSPTLVLGVRTVNTAAFVGGIGLSPQIDFHGAIDTNAFNNGVVTLNSVVTDDIGNNIGNLTVPLLAGGVTSITGPTVNTAYLAFANRATLGFWGGGSEDAAIDKLGGTGLPARLEALDADLVANYDNQNQTIKSDVGSATFFTDTEHTYSGYYGAGFEAGSSIRITLDKPMSDADTMKWKVTLPITVSYV